MYGFGSESKKLNELIRKYELEIMFTYAAFKRYCNKNIAMPVQFNDK